MKTFHCLFAGLLLLGAHFSLAQPTLIFSIGTGDDDLREGSRVNVTVIYFNPERSTIVRDLAAGSRFPDRTTNTGIIALPDGVLLQDIQEIRVEFVPNKRTFMEDDKWWFTRLVVTYSGPGGSANLYENNNVAKKFERQETWSTGVLPTFSNTRTSTVRVVDAAGRPAPNADVYLRVSAGSPWLPLGTTNTNGQVTTTREMTTASVLVARQRVHEQNYYRSFHNQNSTQNWNYRVYLTNLDIDREGRITPSIQGLGTRAITLRVRRENTLIGCNLVACAQWDISASEVETYRNVLRDASNYLYNATDGQFYFEQLTLTDQGNRWDDSDFRIYNQPSATFRANVPNQTGAFLGQNAFGSCMKLARDDDFTVYAHEFGHYGLDVRDEYKDNTNVSCTGAVFDPSGTFAMSNPKASCMMWNQWGAPKLCSTHALNPHMRGTRQGDLSCWDKIKSRYNHSPLWLLRSPVDRGGIPGTLVFGSEPFNAIPFLVPVFNNQTNDAAGLLARHTARAETVSTGAPLERVEISTIGPAFAYHGLTDATGSLLMPGAHSGEEIMAMHSSGVGAVATVAVGSSLTILPLAVDAATPGSATPNRAGLSVRPAFADLRVNIRPLSTARCEVVVKWSRKLKARPTAILIPEGTGRAVTLQETSTTAPDSAVFSFVPPQGFAEGVIMIRGEYEDNSLLRHSEYFVFAGRQADEIFALNGQVSVVINGKKSDRSTFVLHTGRKHLTTLPKDWEAVMLPVEIKALYKEFFMARPSLEMRLPRTKNGALAPQINANTLSMLRFDPVKQTWAPVPGFVLNSNVKLFSGVVDQDGVYCLVQRRGK